MSKDDEEYLEGEMPWSEIDEIGFRKNLRARLQLLPDQFTHEERMRAFTQLLSVAREEIGRVFRRDVYDMLDARDTRAQAMEAAEAVNREMSQLGLAIEHPDTGAHSQIGVTRNKQPGNTWFQIEPVGLSRTTPPHPIPVITGSRPLSLIPLPMDGIESGRAKGRG